MKNESPIIKYLKDYQAPHYLIERIHLEFTLSDEDTFVTSTMDVTVKNPGEKLVLDGEELVFVGAKIDGVEIPSSNLIFTEETLTISNLPASNFKLEIKNTINPKANTALDGLYKSSGIFCTQNEPEGFRRITYFIDRPDNLAIYTTKIIADKKQCPILLSNGNLVESGDLDDGKHFAVWSDPFPKPSYLYALVAGDLGLVQDSFKTMSGREIDLRIYVDKGNESKCHHAMESLKNSMKWDEERFGLEYDLDIYMVVAVDSFNMGAMENKGLNIFNSAYVLADKETATDDNFYGIESVIGHEYFHNWTGNRVTCRDWFQLTLKEGLTVFRDQEFSADLNSRAVCRINDVKGLRGFQFAEDAGPTAHPIKPKSYIEMNNFYTSTIYEKGSEVIRMIYTILDPEGFRKGMDKYFELFDGKAVTTEDFVHAMSVANANYDFSQFKLWYDQAGTPKLDVTFHHDIERGEFKISVKQTCQNVGGEKIEKKPFHMPIKLGLVKTDGSDHTLTLAGRSDQDDVSRGILHLKNTTEDFVFTGVNEKVVPSFNRDFSAPVKIKSNTTKDDLAFLMANDSNEFNRYESFLTYSKELLQDMIQSKNNEVEEKFALAFGKILDDDNIDDDFKTLCLTLPSISDIVQDQEIHAYKETKLAIDVMTKNLALRYQDKFIAIYQSITSKESEFKVDAKSMGQRKLKNLCLSYIGLTEKAEKFTSAQYQSATNMTDLLGALKVIVHNDLASKSESLQSFYNRFKDQTLVMQKWLSVQATSEEDSTFQTVQELLKSDIYDKTVPNLVRALVGTFARNEFQFNHESGRGIQFVASQIKEVDKINPQVASRLASAFREMKKMPSNLQKIARQELEVIIAIDGLSKNVYEIVSKTLA